MSILEEEQTEEWKKVLRSAFIAGMTGTQEERIQACVDVGYYYMCYAPSSLYKYYSDKPRNLEAVKNNNSRLGFLLFRLSILMKESAFIHLKPSNRIYRESLLKALLQNLRIGVMNGSGALFERIVRVGTSGM